MPYVFFQISVPIYLPRFKCCNLIGFRGLGFKPCSSCCARVEEVLPTYLLLQRRLQRRESSWKQTGERDARRRPIEELTNAIESEEAAEEEEQE
jgi:hypothetical protein